MQDVLWLYQLLFPAMSICDFRRPVPCAASKLKSMAQVLTVVIFKLSRVAEVQFNTRMQPE
jgi:hypothetical protein